MRGKKKTYAESYAEYVLARNDLFLGKRGHDTLYSTGGFSDLFCYLLLGNLGTKGKTIS